MEYNLTKEELEQKAKDYFYGKGNPFDSLPYMKIIDRMTPAQRAELDKAFKENYKKYLDENKTPEANLPE